MSDTKNTAILGPDDLDNPLPCRKAAISLIRCTFDRLPNTHVELFALVATAVNIGEVMALLYPDIARAGLDALTPNALDVFRERIDGYFAGFPTHQE